MSFTTVIFLFTELLIIFMLFRAVGALLSPERADTRRGLVYQVTEPILAPLRRVLPRLGRVDLSPFVAIAVLQIIMLILYFV